jgi:hypothetical protein
MPWVRDEDGRLVDPERDRISWDEDRLSFLGTRWQLFEVSLVGVPADAASMIRSLGSYDDQLTNVRARMVARARMVSRLGKLMRLGAD